MYAGPEIKKWSALAFALLLLTGGALKAAIADESKQLVIVGIEGKLEFSRAGSQSWDPSYTNQHLLPGDRLRTGQHSRATFQFGGTMGNLDQNSSLLVPDPAEKPVIPLLEGIFYFFHRDKPDQYRLRTPMASAVVRGTEFVIKIEPGGATTITLLEGAADIQTTNETISLSGKEQLVLAPGAKPVRTPVLDAMNVIQWRLYYPAVLDLEELPLNDSEREALRKSISSYHDGDLLRALEDYPENRQPYSVAERVYQAGLMLAVGRVDEAQSILPQTGDLNRPAEALRELIAAVQFREFHRTQPAKLASEWLAESYYLQSRASIDPEALDKALAAAGQAVAASTNFGFAWARLAELEFSFGKTGPALDALERALKLTPRNAQAMALQGFLFSAQNRITRALQSFEQAIALDNGLANGWLGRGLCRIKKGDAAGGYLDLLTAAALEPQRSLLRSYLGKAYADAGDDAHATHELKLALELDPKDPTGWLYSALHKQQQNRINEAITDLETSQELNDSRSLFRSRFLLDEDRAVRSANLASIYRDAGMTDVSVREAAKAVTYDYANDSAHLFLADSYNELRDPTRFNLRYETVWFNEMLLANLLAPVGGGRLSQHVSQQEYSRLFEANGFGLANSTLYRSDGRLEELASQYGTFDRTSYSFDLDYQHNDGVRPNNSLNSIEWYTTFKQQLTPADTALVLIKYENYHSGDNFQYYDPTNARPHFKFDEYQEPIIFGAWHHEWSPNIHTLLLGGRISQEQNFSDKKASQLLLVEDSAGATYASDFEPFDVTYRNQLELYSVELCQIFQWDRVNLTFGARYQAGEIRTESSFTNPPSGLAVLFSNPVAYGNFSEDVERITGYGYLTLEPINHVRIIGGLAYDDISYPSNFRNQLISGGQNSK